MTIHGGQNWDHLLHLECVPPNGALSQVYHVRVSGDGWLARVVELGIHAKGRDQAETLRNLMDELQRRGFA